MLGLKADTNPAWITAACANTAALLIDHAHCERKAAAFAMTLMQRYPTCMDVVKEMIAIVQEETEHFALVFEYIQQRGLTLRHETKGVYARRLHEAIRTADPERMLDMLLTGAIIEARSCERFSLLAKHIADPQLASFYESLLASEAGHYATYTTIARNHFPAREVKRRLTELLEYEADIVRSLPNIALMHG